MGKKCETTGFTETEEKRKQTQWAVGYMLRQIVFVNASVVPVALPTSVLRNTFLFISCTRAMQPLRGILHYATADQKHLTADHGDSRLSLAAWWKRVRRIAQERSVTECVRTVRDPDTTVSEWGYISVGRTLWGTPNTLRLNPGRTGHVHPWQTIPCPTPENYHYIHWNHIQLMHTLTYILPRHLSTNC